MFERLAPASSRRALIQSARPDPGEVAFSCLRMTIVCVKKCIKINDMYFLYWCLAKAQSPESTSEASRKECFCREILARYFCITLFFMNIVFEPER
jgi:hypothetical protein